MSRGRSVRRADPADDRVAHGGLAGGVLRRVARRWCSAHESHSVAGAADRARVPRWAVDVARSRAAARPPDRWNWVNSAVGSLPLAFWVPFPRYKALHIQHHRSDLTDPEDDPESFYVRPPVWQQAGPLRRRMVPVPPHHARSAHRRRAAGHRPLLDPRDPHRPRRRSRSAPWVAARRSPRVVLGVVAVRSGGHVPVGVRRRLLPRRCGVHAAAVVRRARAVAEGTRCAVVKAGPAMSLLFLNNNLHHTHHAAARISRGTGSRRCTARWAPTTWPTRGAGLYRGGYCRSGAHVLLHAVLPARPPAVAGRPSVRQPRHLA